MRRVTAFWLAVFLCITSVPGISLAQDSGGNLKLTLGLEAGRLTGSTLYHITVPFGGDLVESELEWSLDSWLAGVKASLEGEGPWSAEFSIFTNLSDGSGLMEDSDWINGTLVIFSESQVEADAFTAFRLDAAGTYHFLRRPTLRLGATVGLLYEHFDLTAADLVQFSPVGLTEFDAVVPGPVVAYTVSYTVPYAGATLLLSPSPRLSLALEVLAGYASAADEDDHLLRLKLSEAEADGLALMAKAAGAYSVSSRFSLTASLEVLSIETSGEQDQVFYGGPTEGTRFTGIADEIDTGQVLVTLGGSYRF